MKRISLVPTIAIGAIGIVFGILVAALSGVILDVILIMCGVMTLLSGLPQLIGAVEGLVAKKKIAIFDLVMSIVTIVVGIMLVFYRNEIVMIVIGAFLFVFPLIRTLVATNKLAQLKTELPSMILGVVLMLIAPAAIISILGSIVGAVIILFSLFYIAVGLFSYFKAKRIVKKADGPRVFVDTDGNGKVDTVYVDTTRDGNFDTEIRIKED